MNPVTINRRRFLRTYKQVAFALQLLCCLATTATFIRILHEHQLPLVFLVLPSLLFLIVSIDRCLPLHDRYLISIFTGAATGFISGFISNVVVRPNFDRTEAPRQHRYASLISTLEFLHLPVICGAVMYSFCLVFSRLPPLNIVILSFAIATCGMVVLNIATMMIYDPEKSDVIGIGRSASVVVFLLIFVVALSPSVKANKQAWLLCVVAFAFNIYWQAGFFDVLQWNWETSSFPIPGFLTGLVILFLLDVVDLRETEDRLRFRRLNQQTEANEERDAELSKMASDNNVITALTWHSFSYIVERTSLTFIMQSRGNSATQRTTGSDTWICCLAMLGILLFLTSWQQVSLTIRLVNVILGLFLYICLTALNGSLTNGYFLDDVFGLAFFATAVTSPHIAS